MQLIKFDPFSSLQQMDQQLDNLWGNWGMLPSLKEFAPMDMYEENGKLVTKISLPNFTKDEVRVATNENILEVSALHKDEEKKDNSKRRYHFQESSSQYVRRVNLPQGVKAEDAEADFKDGVLTIAMTYESPNKYKELKIK